MRVDLLAVSTLPVRLSMYCMIPWRRFLLLLVKYRYSPPMAHSWIRPSSTCTQAVAMAKITIHRKYSFRLGSSRRESFLFVIRDSPLPQKHIYRYISISVFPGRCNC